MKSKFEHFLDTKEGKFILRGKLRKDERFSLCLIRRELSDRWSKDFNPLQIHSICSKVGNVKKMLVIWEILYNYTDLDKNYHLDCIFNPNESTKDGNQRIYLVIEEKTKYQVSKIPLPLDHMPFTFEEYQENCKFLYNRIFQLECIKLAQEKEINELKQQLNTLILQQSYLRARQITKNLTFCLFLGIGPQMTLSLTEHPFDTVKIIAALVLQGGGTDGGVHRLVVEEQTPNGRSILVGNPRPRDFPNFLDVDHWNIKEGGELMDAP